MILISKKSKPIIESGESKFRQLLSGNKEPGGSAVVRISLNHDLQDGRMN